jgi:hypothetical protein
LLSVAVERTFSMSAGLVTSTVTPGSAPPDASRAWPEIVPVWAYAEDGSRTRATANAANTDLRVSIWQPLCVT